MNLSGFNVADLRAGVAIAGLLLPEAVAYSSIANLPPQAGIVSLGVGLLTYAVVGSSRFAIMGATSSSAAVLAASVHALSPTGSPHALPLAAAMVLMAGLFFILAGSLRIGRLVNFIAKPVMQGFTFGLALIITFKQIAKMVGFVHPSGNIFGFALELIRHWSQWNVAGLLMGLSALAVLGLCSLVRALPGPLLVIVLGILANQFYVLQSLGIPLVGPIALSTISATLPDLDPDHWSHVGQLAVALTLILFAESHASIRTFAAKHEATEATDRDLLALGVSNLCAGLLGGTPVGAGFSATSANKSAGAESKAAGLYAALAIGIAIVLFLPYIETTPEPVLAAIVVYALRHNLSLRPFVPYVVWHRDRFISGVAILGVLTFGIVNGLLIAIAVSVIMTVRLLSQPKLAVLGRLGNSHVFVDLAMHKNAYSVPDILILRPEALLFFANVEPMLQLARDTILASTNLRAVILSLEESPDLDGTSVQALIDFSYFVHCNGYRFLLARVKDSVEVVLRRTHYPALTCALRDADSVEDCVRELGSVNNG